MNFDRKCNEIMRFFLFEQDENRKDQPDDTGGEEDVGIEQNIEPIVVNFLPEEEVIITRLLKEIILKDVRSNASVSNITVMSLDETNSRDFINNVIYSVDPSSPTLRNLEENEISTNGEVYFAKILQKAINIDYTPKDSNKVRDIQEINEVNVKKIRNFLLKIIGSYVNLDTIE